MKPLFVRGEGLPEAASAEGCWVIDRWGRRYLDASSGALVANLGHGDRSVVSAISEQMQRLSYVHPTAFTSEVSERYAGRLAGLLPMDGAAVFPVSGGSEATETALKAVRAYHLARGEAERTVVIGRELSYHGNTRGALDVSGREPLRRPYEPYLGLAGRVPAVLEYRCPNPGHPEGCSGWHARALEHEIQRIGTDRVAAFIAEPVGGAASGAAVPPSGYWEKVAEVCLRYDVLIIADEVMTGFGRTGRWFASEHFDLRPDVITSAKGAAAGYWPLGFCALSGEVAETLRTAGFVHGFTFSHHVVGAAAGLAVIDRLESLGLVSAAEQSGRRLRRALDRSIGGHPSVGDIRGIGLMLAVELVADTDTKEPFPTATNAALTLTERARDEGLIIYPSTGCAGGGSGDLVMIGPPLTISDDEIDTLVEKLVAAFGRF